MKIKGEPFSSGSEKRVFQDPTHSDRVVKIYDRESISLPEVKARFYFGNLLHLLFPENIPYTHISSQEKGEAATLVQNKVFRDDGHVKMSDLITKNKQLRSEGDLATPQHTTQEVHELEIERKKQGIGGDLIVKLHYLGIDFDKLQRNFSRQSDGADVYLDTFNPWRIHLPKDDQGSPDYSKTKILTLNFDKKMMIQAIEDLQDPSSRTKANTYLERLEALADQERKERNSTAWRA